MKYAVLTLITLSLFACNKKKNDLADQELKGNVKQVITKTYEVSEKFGDVQKGRMTAKIVDDYNEDGNIIRSSYTDIPNPDSSHVGPEEFISLFEYKDGKRSLHRDGKTHGIEEAYKYDGDKLIEIDGYNEKGALNTKAKLKYNPDELVEEFAIYNNDGTLYRKELNKYNSSKHLIEQDELNSENKVTDVIWFNYDSNSKMTGYKVKSKYSTDNYTIKMSKIDNGNWLKSVKYDNGKPDELKEREIKYY